VHGVNSYKVNFICFFGNTLSLQFSQTN